MKDEIFEILIAHFGWQRKASCEKASQETADYFKRYIEWKDREYYFVAGLYFEKAEADTPFHNRPRYTFDALYKYYCDNVLNLKDK